jgi:1-acyl-sn-glycerol-3-phosphate acyltransferase
VTYEVQAGAPRWWQQLLYGSVRNLVTGLSRAFFRLEVVGKERIPASGPFILAPVHRDNVDTPIISAVTRRRMRYLGKQEMWKFRWSAWFFSNMGGIPVNRGAPDRDALRHCQAVLEAGEPLVLFPEGTRHSGPIVRREDLHEGVSYLALRAGAPIVPVGIGGSEGAQPKGSKFLRPHKVVLVVGEPIPVEKVAGGRVRRPAVHELTDRLRDELQILFDEAQVRAGH